MKNSKRSGAALTHQKPLTRQGDGETLASQRYDRRRLSYAGTFENPFQRHAIQFIELVTGRLRLLKLIRKFEKLGVPEGQAFWKQALHVMGIELTTPHTQSDRIPATGPLVIVANHPRGLVDGMALAELVGRVRTDYKILTRSLLTGVGEIDQFMIPVPFPHESGSLGLNLDMRSQAMAHLKEGGVIVLFPSGCVASADRFWGPVIEREWLPFTAKMIQRSNARVLPIFFPGHNSRMYQFATRVSATLRQGLLLYEVVDSLNKPQSPIVGTPIERDEVQPWASNPRGFVTWLREKTLALRNT
ncbi:MAG: putative hemolysin [Paracoccaceae bacterium]|jgi:putative hemolysin